MSFLFYIQTKAMMSVSKSGIKKEPLMETVVQMELTSFHAKPGIYTHSAIVNSRCNSLSIHAVM